MAGDNQTGGGPDLGQYTFPINDVHINTGQSLVLITEDKLKVCLIEHEKCINKGASWVTPVSLLATFIVVLTTATFREFLFSAEVWQAVFIISTALTGIWSVRSVLVAISSRGDLDTLIAAIKQKSAKHELAHAVADGSAKTDGGA